MSVQLFINIFLIIEFLVSIMAGALDLYESHLVNYGITIGYIGAEVLVIIIFNIPFIGIIFGLIYMNSSVSNIKRAKAVNKIRKK